MEKKTIKWLAAAGAACAGLACFAAFGIHRHDWQAATCTAPETCAGCGETQGEALGHIWEDATCVLPVTCGRCGETEGEPLGHVWGEANFQTAAVCEVCGESGDAPLPGWFEQNGIACGAQENTAYPYQAVVYGESGEKTGGWAIVTGGRTLISDETHPAQEGYEWLTARIELVFGGQEAWTGGVVSAWYRTDYYDPELFFESREQVEPETDEDPDTLRYTVNYNGQDYDRCVGYFTDPVHGDGRYALRTTSIEGWFLVPEGYDGTVVMLADSSYDLENYIAEGRPLDEMEDAEGIIQSAAFIRLVPDAPDDGKPQMAVLSGILPLQPGGTLESGAVIRSGPEQEAGFFGLEKVSELAEYDAEDFWDRDPIYENTTLPEETELPGELQLPDEEGVYRVTAAVRDKSGNAVTAALTLLVDGTGPEISVPRSKVTLKPGSSYDFSDGVSLEDNFFAAEDCWLYMDADELEALQAAAGSGRAGTYPFT